MSGCDSSGDTAGAAREVNHDVRILGRQGDIKESDQTPHIWLDGGDLVLWKQSIRCMLLVFLQGPQMGNGEAVQCFQGSCSDTKVMVWHLQPPDDERAAGKRLPNSMETECAKLS